MHSVILCREGVIEVTIILGLPYCIKRSCSRSKVAEMGIIMYLFKYWGISLPPHLPWVFPRSGMIKGWYITDLLTQLTHISFMHLLDLWLLSRSQIPMRGTKHRGPSACWGWGSFCNNFLKAFYTFLAEVELMSAARPVSRGAALGAQSPLSHRPSQDLLNFSLFCDRKYWLANFWLLCGGAHDRYSSSFQHTQELSTGYWNFT